MDSTNQKYFVFQSEARKIGKIINKSCLRDWHLRPRFPAAGRSVPEFQGTTIDLPEVIYHGYRIIYRLTPSQDAEIITVAHGREGLVNNLNKDWIL